MTWKRAMIMRALVCLWAGSGAFSISLSASAESKPDASSGLTLGPSYEEALKSIREKFPAPTNSKTKTIIVYYCWPDTDDGFRLLNHEDCLGIERSHPDVIKVIYNHFPSGKQNISDTHPSYLEGMLSLDLPQDFNLEVSGKTPYESAYKNYNSDVARRLIKVEAVKDERFDGLRLYLTENDIGRYKNTKDYDFSKLSRHWVSVNDYRTRIGNPFLVGCDPLIHCHTQLDLGNGWVVEAKFPEHMLMAWEQLLGNLELSERNIWRY